MPAANTTLTVAYLYTLTDEDVVMEDGIMISCSYDFAFTDIIVPDVLYGQSMATDDGIVIEGGYLTDLRF